MREIKFRAWVKQLKKISAVNELYFDGGAFVCDYDFALERNDIEVMQFTGLKDKNGVEIYEGDIVKAFTVFGMVYDYEFRDDNDPTNIYQVVFDDGCFQFKNTKQWSDGTNDWRSIENVELFKVEIIGNIYENPELLK